MTDVELIKSRIDIVDIIGEYVSLKPAGANMKAQCPFHDEKTPSFMVHRGKQIFHCFGCGEGGDVFTFIQKRENVDFPEALKILANKAGVRLKTYDAKHENEKSRLKTLMERAVEFYRKQINTDAGTPARKYLLKNRRLEIDIVREFQIGFAPDGWDVIGPYLAKLGFSDEEIIKSGLVVQKDNSSGYYDRFRKRIMFPILDANGLPIGFTGRLLPEDEGKEKSGGKYINTPETPLYHKAFTLYGLSHAKEHIRKTDMAIFVEGQMDVIASHMANVKSAVASSGTAIVSDQFRIIKRFSRNILFALDQDDAGMVALKRSALIAWRSGCDAYVVPMHEGCKDPADMVKQNPKLWEQAVKNHVPFMEYMIERVCSEKNLSIAKDKKQATDELVQILKHMPDPVERGHYISVISSRMRIYEQDIREKLRTTKTYKQTTDNAKGVSNAKTDSIVDAPKIPPIDLLLALVLRNESMIGEMLKQIEIDTTNESEYHEFYKFLNTWYSGDKQSYISKTITASDDDTLKRHYNVLELLGEKEYGNLAGPEVQREFKRLVSLHNKRHISKELSSIEQQLKIQESQSSRDEELIARLSNRFRELTKKLKNIS